MSKKKKTYKKKYTTKDRLDMSKGGRVQAANGFKMPRRKKGELPSVFARRVAEARQAAQGKSTKLPVKKPTQPVKKPVQAKPVQPVRKPIGQAPQKPVQPGIPVTGGGNLGSGKMPKADFSWSLIAEATSSATCSRLVGSSGISITR